MAAHKPATRRSIKSHAQTLAQLAHQVEWLRVFFLTVLPVYGFWQIHHTPLLPLTTMWALFMYAVTGIGITAGYHRLWAHCSYSATFSLRLFLALAGTGALQGSIRWWSSRHRSHHRYTDTELDPYSVNKGFLHAHVGWMVWKRAKTSVGSVDIRDLRNDPIVEWQHKHIALLQLFTGVIIPTAVPGLLWGDWKGGFVYAFIMRMFAVHHATFCVNSLAHWLGEASFDDRHSPRDHFVTALFTFGEGYHNFHHTFPADYRNAVKWYQYDPTKWIIQMWGKMGLAYELKTFPTLEVDKSRLQQKQKVLADTQREIAVQLRGMDRGIPLASLPIMEWEEYEVEAKVEGEVLVAIAGVVYDVKRFAKEHPGGSALIMAAVGKDATARFNGGVYAHSRIARNLLEGMRIAVIRGGGEVEVWKNSYDSHE